MAYDAGLFVEDRIADDYERRRYPVAQRRWRGKGGEINLIAQDGDGLVFIEVKQSCDFDQAALHLSPRQMTRLYAIGEESLGQIPKGSLTGGKCE